MFDYIDIRRIGLMQLLVAVFLFFGASLIAQEDTCCDIYLGKEYSSVKEVYDVNKPEVWRDFALQGEYKAYFDGQNAGLQLIALDEGKFDFIVYTGGLPGAGWNPGAIRMFGSGVIQDDQLVLTTERILSVDTVYPVQEVIKITPYRFEIAPYAEGMTNGPACQLERVARGVIPLPKWEKVYRNSTTYGLEAPQDAFIFFRGIDTQNFNKNEATIYEQVDGPALVAGPISKQFDQWRPFTFHCDFMTTYRPAARGQHRCNSGIFFAETYELQILDSFGIEPDMGECGALYSSRKPDINICYPPLVWQTFDIEFTPPQFENGEKVSDSIWTVKQNGVIIHDNYRMVKKTPADKPEVKEPRGIYLQPGHANHAQFRNMWFDFKE